MSMSSHRRCLHSSIHYCLCNDVLLIDLCSDITLFNGVWLRNFRSSTPVHIELFPFDHVIILGLDYFVLFVMLLGYLLLSCHARL